MMPRILHAMNTVYGKVDQYGVRSRFIAESLEKSTRIEVFAKSTIAAPRADVGFHKVSASVPFQAARYFFAALNLYQPKKRMIGAGFDASLRRAVRRAGTEGVDLIHTWEYIPRTIEELRSDNPNLKVVRDVVVNRFKEFYSDVPITEEASMVDCFVSPSAFSTKCLIEWGIDPAKIAEIPFGVDSVRFAPITDKPASPLRFAFTGGISKRKGCDSLIRVWKRLGLKDAELHLYGRVRNDVAADLRGASGIVCHGHIDLGGELPRNHAFVFPSTLEGSAKSVYEALACGMPAIVTPEAGSIVRDGVDGMIVEAGNEDQLADAMLHLHRDRDGLARMGTAARSWAQEHSWERYTETVRGLYGKTLAV